MRAVANASAIRKRANGHTKQTTLRLHRGDLLRAEKLIRAGWATTFTGAVRYALKRASDEVSK